MENPENFCYSLLTTHYSLADSDDFPTHRLMLLGQATCLSYELNYFSAIEVKLFPQPEKMFLKM
jgi:hypothetical protein